VKKPYKASECIAGELLVVVKMSKVLEQSTRSLEAFCTTNSRSWELWRLKAKNSSKMQEKMDFVTSESKNPWLWSK